MADVKDPAYVISTASFAGDYRYSLVRRWDRGPSILWIMLNPSTADADKLDPTLRRVLRFTAEWRYGAFEVCNIYALRSTDPAGLWRHPDTVGPSNDAYIREAAYHADLAIVGWGANAKPERESQVEQILYGMGITPMCIGITASGSPKHPLYIAAATAFGRWRGRSTT